MNYDTVLELKREIFAVVKTEFSKMADLDQIVEFLEEDLVPMWIDDGVCTRSEGREALNMAISELSE